jgi:hypothetical protein
MIKYILLVALSPTAAFPIGESAGEAAKAAIEISTTNPKTKGKNEFFEKPDIQSHKSKQNYEEK